MLSPQTIGSPNAKPISQISSRGALSSDVKAGLEAIGWDKQKSNKSAAERQQIPFSVVYSLDIPQVSGAAGFVNLSSPGRLTRTTSNASMHDRKSIVPEVLLEALFAAAALQIDSVPSVAAASREVIGLLRT